MLGTPTTLLGPSYTGGNVLFVENDSEHSTIICPVGGRIGAWNLSSSTSTHLGIEHRRNVVRVAVTKTKPAILLSIDNTGRALFTVNNAVIAHFTFPGTVGAVEFCEEGNVFAVGYDGGKRRGHIQIYTTPSPLMRQFAPLTLLKTFTGHTDGIVDLAWAKNSGPYRGLISSSADGTARLWRVPMKDTEEGLSEDPYRPKTFAGHHASLIGAYFGEDKIYSVSTDAAVFVWDGDEEDEERDMFSRRWHIDKKHYLSIPHATLTAACYGSSLLCVGYSNGVFAIYDTPAMSNLHMLSVGIPIMTIQINGHGDWIALGTGRGSSSSSSTSSPNGSSLIVYEYASSSYVLRSTSHSAATITFAWNAGVTATGSHDSKIKLWRDNACFATFDAHSAGITALEFNESNGVLWSASLDGTVRAFDMTRYRNFRVLTAPHPTQFGCLAVGGEVVVAGSVDTFEVFMWSVQGTLLDVLSGHTAPVSSLAFVGNTLYSGSWDGTVRAWTVFSRTRTSEPISVGSEVLAMAVRPDAKEIAVAGLNGDVTFLGLPDMSETRSLDGRRDLAGASDGAKRIGHFTTLAYTSDSTSLIAGSNTKFVCLYSIQGQEVVLLRRVAISDNLDLYEPEWRDSRLDGMVVEEESDVLPGTKALRSSTGTTCVRYSPTGKEWAVASVEGVLVFPVSGAASSTFSGSLSFGNSLGPLTPQSTLEALAKKEYALALGMALRLGEKPLVERVLEGIGGERPSVPLILRSIDPADIPSLLELLCERLLGSSTKSPHLEYNLVWVRACLGVWGEKLRNGATSTLRAAKHALNEVEATVGMAQDNCWTLRYLVDQANQRLEVA
ncbi:WD repeat protein [Mycena floridula]|nr:WD repeat protein [Mycena floridula]